MFWVVVANIIKTILLVKKYAALLNSLKDGQLVRGLISDVIIGNVTDALVSAGIPVDSLNIVGEARKYFEDILDETASALVDCNVILTLDELYKGFEEELTRLRKGLSVGNGRPPVQHQSKGGDPIFLHRGEFQHTSNDIVVRGAGADLTFRRVYRSGADYLGSIGRSWDHSFNLALVEIDSRTVSVMTGDLSQLRFVRHPEFGMAGFDYYVPQAGVHNIIERDGGSYRMQRPGGSWVRYEEVDPGHHRARSLHDPAGNQVDLEYGTDDRLLTAYANGPHRYLSFNYRSDGLLERVKDHTGRSSRYFYDEAGLLVRAEQTTDVAGQPCMTAEMYEYHRVGESRRLSRLSDETGRVLIENDYDVGPSSTTFGYVLNQFTERGPTNFVYEKLSPAGLEGLLPPDVPEIRVFETPPDGHVVEHLLNSAGNELMRREDYVEDGRIRTALIRSRFNVDGAVIARMDGEGGLVQSLYGRQHVEGERVDGLPFALEGVTAAERMGFGNELATIERGRPMPEFDRVAEQPEWISAVPSVYSRADPDDAIVKRVFSPATQLLLTVSDVRATLSPDPMHVESAPVGSNGYDPANPVAVAHRNLMTVHEYTAVGLRTKTTLPRRTSVDGGAPSPMVEETLLWDGRGRPLAQTDRRGYITYRQYYPESANPVAGAWAGYLWRETRPHTDWTLNDEFPSILEVQRAGEWTMTAVAMRSTAANGSLRMHLECQRIELWQTREPVVASACSAARVTVDGIPHGIWNQQFAATYLIDRLTLGPHVIEISANVAGLMVGRVIGHTIVSFDVDQLGRVVATTNSRGVTTRTDYDSHDRVVAMHRGIGADAVAEWTRFNRSGDVVSEHRRWHDADGNPIAGGIISTTYQYDSRGLPTVKSTRTLDPADSRTARIYHDLRGVEVAVSNGRGISTRWRVDTLGRQVRQTRAACTPAQSITDTHFDRCGRPTRVTEPNGAERLTEFSPRGIPLSETDPLGSVTVIRSDLGRRPVTEQRFGRRPDGSYELASRVDTVYDELGDMVVKTSAIFSEAVPSATPSGDTAFLAGRATGDITTSIHQYLLDADGRIIREQVDGVEEVRRSYDPAGRVVQEESSTGRRFFWVYDGEGNILRKYAFDPACDPSGMPAAFLESYSYDAHNRRVTSRDYYGNLWRTSYDTVSRVTRTVDPLDRRVTLQHNAFGQEISRSEGDPPSTVISKYDRAGNRIAIIDELGHRHLFTYDALNRVVLARNASMMVDPGIVTEYDRCDRVIRETDRCGVVSLHRYDAAGRRVRSDWDWSTALTAISPLSANHLTVDYDARGYPCRYANDWAVVVQRRDSRGLICKEHTRLLVAGGVGTHEWAVAQIYDKRGGRLELEFPSGRRVKYRRDRSGRVRGVENAYVPVGFPGSPLTSAPAELADYRYGGGRWLSVSLPIAHCAMTIDYDGRGQECQRTVTELASGAQMWRRQAFLDPARNTAFETVETGDDGNSRTRHFSVDSRRRLVGYRDAPAVWLDVATQAPAKSPLGATHPTAQAAVNAARSADPPTNTFVYDDAGNRIVTSEGGAAPVASTPDADNRYVNMGADAWSYDHNGRLLANSQRRYSYDASGLLTEEFRHVPGGAREVGYLRDGIGRIVAAITSAGNYRFAWIDRHPLVRWDPDGAVTEITPGRTDAEPVHIASRAEDTWIYSDPLNTPRLLLRRGGAVDTHVVVGYRPYGQPEAAAADIPLGFAGLNRFPKSFVLQAFHRSYDPRTGRFLQQDPAGYADGPNRYVYARNNPVDLVDPLGLEGLSPSTMRILEYIERVAQLLHDDPSHWEESPQVRGMNKHQEFAFVMDRTNSFGEDHPLHNFFSDGNDADRIASELWIDDKGVIQKINGDPYNAPAGWRTVDAAVVKEGLPGGKHSIVGQRAEDVIDFVIDYKTGNAALKERAALEALIGNKPVVRVLGRPGQLLRALTMRFKYLAALKVSTKVAKWGLKKAGQTLPVVGFFVTYSANSDASTEMRIARGLAGEIGVGPVDLETVYDAADWTFGAVQDGIQAFAEWATPHVLGALDGRSRQQITRGLGF